jgi:hypothetical protein
MSLSRRRSDVLIGSDCLDNKSLHFFNTIENYDPNEMDHVLTMHKSVKDFYKRTNFSFVELESKRLFLEALKTVSETGEGLPMIGGPAGNDPNYIALENAHKNRQTQYAELKDKLKQSTSTLSGQIKTVLQLFEDSNFLKDQYEKKWEEFDRNLYGGSNDENNAVTTNGPMVEEIEKSTSRKSELSNQIQQQHGYFDLMSQIQPETREEIKDWSNVSRRLVFTDEEAFSKDDINAQKLQEHQIQMNEIHQINSILSFINGVSVVQFAHTQSQIVCKLHLTGIKSEQVKMSILLDKAVGTPSNRDIWKLSLVDVALPNITMQRSLNFEDIVEIGKKRNDIGFIVSEVTIRIQLYLQHYQN